MNIHTKLHQLRKIIQINFHVDTKNKKETLGPLVAQQSMTDQRSGTICEDLVKCIMRNNSVKLY